MSISPSRDNLSLICKIHAVEAKLIFCKLKPSLANKIFDTMISPILPYNSEVWGVFVKSDFKSWDNSGIEKTHLHFCKLHLEVHNKSSNVACRSELGRFPLIININNKILKS